MRLIDADALKADLIESKEKLWEIYNGLSHHIDKQICGGQIGSFVEAILRTKDAPTIDAVPVVRCKDCTYRADPMECPMCFEEYTDLSEDEWDSIISDSTVDDGFCHHGKRKDGEG